MSNNALSCNFVKILIINLSSYVQTMRLQHMKDREKKVIKVPFFLKE